MATNALSANRPGVSSPVAQRNGSGLNLFGVNPASSTYAGDTFAALTRQQWSDFITTFVPLENQLIAQATDPQVVRDAMSEASTNINQSFDAQSASTDRRLRGLGIQLSPEEQAARKRSEGLTRSLADVGAQNTAREMTVRRQQSVLGNPAPQGA